MATKTTLSKYDIYVSCAIISTVPVFGSFYISKYAFKIPLPNNKRFKVLLACVGFRALRQAILSVRLASGASMPVTKLLSVNLCDLLLDAVSIGYVSKYSNKVFKMNKSKSDSPFKRKQRSNYNRSVIFGTGFGLFCFGFFIELGYLPHALFKICKDLFKFVNTIELENNENVEQISVNDTNEHNENMNGNMNDNGNGFVIENVVNPVNSIVGYIVWRVGLVMMTQSFFQS